MLAIRIRECRLVRKLLCADKALLEAIEQFQGFGVPPTEQFNKKLPICLHVSVSGTNDYPGFKSLFGEQVKANAALYTASTSSSLFCICPGHKCLLETRYSLIIIQSMQYIVRFQLKYHISCMNPSYRTSFTMPVSITTVTSSMVTPVSAILVDRMIFRIPAAGMSNTFS